ncbi:hypothetical protein [Roseateles sp. PN1]|uniref:hypothetical protein n=1 Tax=Roseateles sp. PN1 TaxID=3137372 RepID=UPI003138F4ED
MSDLIRDRMLSYQVLAQAQVAHQYFPAGQTRDLEFRPCECAQALITRHQLVLRSNAQSLTLLAPSTSLQAIWQERPAHDLCWTLASRDRHFSNYSEALPLLQLRLPLVKPGIQDFEAWLQSLADNRQQVTIKARRSIWKFLLVGDWSDHRLQLLDADQRVRFEAGAPERLPDGRQAQVFRSRKRLLMCERPSLRLELHDVGVDPPRRLLARLPGASPRTLSYEFNRGHRWPVSEIFVQR